MLDTIKCQESKKRLFRFVGSTMFHTFVSNLHQYEAGGEN